MYEDGYVEIMQVAKLVELQEKVVSKNRVGAHVRWLIDKYAGKVFHKAYDGKLYEGIVRTVGWHPVSGYGATGKYSDGYIEIWRFLYEQKVLVGHSNGGSLCRYGLREPEWFMA